MCGRYWIDDKDTPADMRSIIDALNRRGDTIKTGEIRPADAAPVIANSRRMTPMPFLMRWGYAMDGSRRVINARSETAASKPLFSGSMKSRRCVIPASGYYEWARRSREKMKYEIRGTNLPMLYLAGLYRLTDGMPEFTILTREPEESVSFLHDRMPVILPPSSLGAWLSPDADPAGIIASARASLIPCIAAGQTQTISFFDIEM